MASHYSRSRERRSSERRRCNTFCSPLRIIEQTDGPRRLYRLDRTLKSAAAFQKWEEAQPQNQHYYNVPCAPGCRCGLPHKFRDSILVSADGACRGNGSQNAQASVGVFFKSESPYNEAHVLPEVHATNQRAEIYAGITALRAVSAFLHGHLPEDLADLESLQLVVVMTDSEYLVKGITDWIFDWKASGWVTGSRGLPVLNADLFKRLDALVFAFKDQYGVTVKFMHVPRELNTGADRLANTILNDWESVARKRRFALKNGRP